MRKIKRQSRNKEAVPLEVIEKTIQKEGFEKSLEKKVKALDKKIEKTDKLIVKAKKKANQEKVPSTSLESNENIKSRSIETHNTISRDATITDYHLLNRLPKQVMKFLFEVHKEQNATEDQSIYVDTMEMKERIGKSANHLANTIMRLKKQGFIEVKNHRNNGVREISLKKSLFS
jgi:hypothetical protein